MLRTTLLAAAIAATATALAAEETHRFADIAWQESGLPGVQLAYAWGEPQGEDETWYIRMEPGVAVPAHAHTHDYWGLTLAGTWVHIHEDGSETATGFGDYAFVPGGINHADRCDGTEACIGIIDFNGIRDAIFPQ